MQAMLSVKGRTEKKLPMEKREWLKKKKKVASLLLKDLCFKKAGSPLLLPRMILALQQSKQGSRWTGKVVLQLLQKMTIIIMLTSVTVISAQTVEWMIRFPLSWCGHAALVNVYNVSTFSLFCSFAQFINEIQNDKENPTFLPVQNSW